MNSYSTPNPGGNRYPDFTNVRLNRDMVLQPAARLPAGTIGMVVPLQGKPGGYMVKFRIAGNDLYVDFSSRPDALELTDEKMDESVPPVVVSEPAEADPDHDDRELHPKLHYYAFSFGHLDILYPDKTARLDCVYMGFPDKRVNIARISEAKSECALSSYCTLISVSYLGHMTFDEMNE